jgi:hypothetical protein
MGQARPQQIKSETLVLRFLQRLGATLLFLPISGPPFGCHVT